MAQCPHCASLDVDTVGQVWEDGDRECVILVCHQCEETFDYVIEYAEDDEEPYDV